jgi:hypothetical protein
MLAMLCDRCGKPVNYEVGPTFPYLLYKLKMLPFPYGGMDEETIDLCEDCKREFKKWLKGEKDGLE